jgi:hypothetical protein
MGTSNSYGGSGGDKPLIPSWLPDGPIPAPPVPSPPPGVAPALPIPPVTAPAIPPAPLLPPMPSPGESARFTPARSSFSRFASSGGRDRKSLGRSISRYVSTASGGSRTAAQRMGASRQTSAQLASFLSGAIANGPREALRSLRLENLAGRPIEEIFLGMMEYVCPEGGTIDDSIAREAFIETIADLAGNGLTDFDTLNADQLQTILELYAAHAIEARLCNDIGLKAVSLPSSVADAANVQEQLFDFVRRSVSDALTNGLAAVEAMTPDRVLGFVTGVYEQAFAILQSMGEAEEDSE